MARQLRQKVGWRLVPGQQRLQCFAGRPMHAAPVSSHQGVICAFLDEGVTKHVRELGLGGREADEVSLFEFAKLAAQARLGVQDGAFYTRLEHGTWCFRARAVSLADNRGEIELMKRIFIELAAQLAVLVVLVLVIATGAIFFGVTTGAMASAIAPDFHLEMADRVGLVCHKGETISIRHQPISGFDSFGRPTTGMGTEIYCVSTAEGTSRQLSDQEFVNAKLAAIGVAMAGYSVACFVPLFVPLEIVALIVIHKVASAMAKPVPASQAVISN